MADTRLTRGQIVEAIQNVLLDYEITEQNWIDNKQKVLEAITKNVLTASEEGGDHPVGDLQNQRLLQKQEREVQWQKILEHWKGIEVDFADLDKNFDLLGDVLAKSRAYWADTTLKTTQELINRNDEIVEQGDKMKDIEDRASKVRKTQDKMTSMMESKSNWMGRMICPIIMCLCCCYLFASLSLGIVLRIGVQQGAWNISSGNGSWVKDAAGNYWNGDKNNPSPSYLSPSPSFRHPNCTSTAHIECVDACDAHAGTNYKKCVTDCSLGC